MKSMHNIIGGLIMIVLGALGLAVWWPEFGLVLRGLVPFGLIIVGLLWIASKYYQKNGHD
jgi:hypothetical protein